MIHIYKEGKMKKEDIDKKEWGTKTDESLCCMFVCKFRTHMFVYNSDLRFKKTE